MKGVVIDKKLFSRAIKTRSSKLADKALMPKIDEEFDERAGEFKKILVDKLLALTDGLVSQGVKDYVGVEVVAKGAKFTKKELQELDYTSIQLSGWTTDERINGMISQLIIN